MSLSDPHAVAFFANDGIDRRAARRDELLGTTRVRCAGGIKLFSGLTAPALAALISERFVDASCPRADGPTAVQFLRLLQRWPAVTARGYVVCRRRESHGVTLDGLECDLAAVPACDVAALRAEFARFARDADEHRDTGGTLAAWWD